MAANQQLVDTVVHINRSPSFFLRDDRPAMDKAYPALTLPVVPGGGVFYSNSAVNEKRTETP